MKETDDISDTIDNDNSDMSDDANNSETDKVKSKTILVSKNKCTSWYIELPDAERMFNKISFAKRKVFMQVYLFILLPLLLILF